jgi:hypothetical protein
VWLGGGLWYFSFLVYTQGLVAREYIQREDSDWLLSNSRGMWLDEGFDVLMFLCIHKYIHTGLHTCLSIYIYLITQCLYYEIYIYIYIRRCGVAVFTCYLSTLPLPPGLNRLSLWQVWLLHEQTAHVEWRTRSSLPSDRCWKIGSSIHQSYLAIEKNRTLLYISSARYC